MSYSKRHLIMSEGNIDYITTDLFVINNVYADICKFIIILVSSALDRLQKGPNYPRGEIKLIPEGMA